MGRNAVDLHLQITTVRARVMSIHHSFTGEKKKEMIRVKKHSHLICNLLRNITFSFK